MTKANGETMTFEHDTILITGIGDIGQRKDVYFNLFQHLHAVVRERQISCTITYDTDSGGKVTIEEHETGIFYDF